MAKWSGERRDVAGVLLSLLLKVLGHLLLGHLLNLWHLNPYACLKCVLVLLGRDESVLLHPYLIHHLPALNNSGRLMSPLTLPLFHALESLEDVLVRHQLGVDVGVYYTILQYSAL